tara:strand:+ start:14768 stop:14902 length:135 start_codon:yes stop_codon:yes gene_type:complete
VKITSFLNTSSYAKIPKYKEDNVIINPSLNNPPDNPRLGGAFPP